jgi:hypothetical protein
MTWKVPSGRRIRSAWTAASGPKYHVGTRDFGCPCENATCSKWPWSLVTITTVSRGSMPRRTRVALRPVAFSYGRAVASENPLRYTPLRSGGQPPMSPFLRRWWQLLSAPWPLLRRFPALIRAIAGGLSALGIGVGGIVTWAFWRAEFSVTVGVVALALLLMFVALLLVAFTALTAGIAWADTHAPSVRIGPIRQQPLTRPENVVGIFYFLVVNGPTPAKVTIRIGVITDSLGAERSEHPWEGHWRGESISHDGEMAEDDTALYGLIGIARLPSGNPTLFIWSRQPGPGQPQTGSTTAVGLTRDESPAEQVNRGPLRVPVTCIVEADGRRITQTVVFHIIPDPTSEVFYRAIDGESPAPQPPTPMGSESLGCG